MQQSSCLGLNESFMCPGAIHVARGLSLVFVFVSFFYHKILDFDGI